MKISGVLDNAPTYVSFLQAAFSVTGVELAPEKMPGFLTGTFTLGGVSGAPAPGFFGYLKYASAVLVPILIAAWALFVRVS